MRETPGAVKRERTGTRPGYGLSYSRRALAVRIFSEEARCLRQIPPQAAKMREDRIEGTRCLSKEDLLKPGLE